MEEEESVNSTNNASTKYVINGDKVCVRKKSKSKMTCCVPGCRSKYQDGNISFHQFPSDQKVAEKWRIVLRVRRQITKHNKVCSLHFIADDFFQKHAFFAIRGDQESRPKAKLKKGVMPTQNIPRRPHDRVLTPSQLKKREERQQRFLKRHAALSAATHPVDHGLQSRMDFINSKLLNEGNHSKTMPHLKNVAKPSINKVEYRWLQGDLAPQSPPCQDFDDDDDEMQKESIIRPPDMLCAIYSLPADANPAELDVQNVVVSSESCTDNNTRVILQEQENLDLVLDTTDDMDSFCSRCLLCTCRPDATPHIEIFSEAGDQLHLAEKLDNSLNIQIEPGLPQRVCRICVEKLDVTYELVTSSKRAKIMLLQIKQRIKNCSMEVTPVENFDIQLTQPFQIKVEPDSTDFNSSEIGPEFDSLYLPAMDSAASNKENSNDINTDEIPMEDSDSTLSTNGLYRPSEKPTMADTTKTGWDDGPSELDFILCPHCPDIIYKGYLAFHVKLNHGDLQPVERNIADERTKEQRLEDRRRMMLLDLIECGLCKKQLYSQVLDLHVLLRHKEQTADLQETSVSRLMQCPACPCMFFPEYMQRHIAEEHPPAPSSHLKLRKECIYCNFMISYCDMDQHLDLEHGPNAWRHCIHCKKKVRNTDTDMEAHLFQDHPGGKFLVCKVCDVRYSKTGKEQAHMQTFHSCKYKCPLQTCSKTFVTLSSFKDHVLFFHPKIEEEMQDEIKKETEDFLASLRKVEEPVPQTVENPEQNIDAPPKTSIFEPIPSQVRRIDYGDPVDCDICKETVRHKWFLIKHKNEVHNMNLLYNCEDCGKGYQIMQGILSHIHRSHMPKDQICEICGEAFSKRQYWTHLRWHKRYPNGPPQRNFLDRPLDPVRCGMCNRPARSKYALLTHINAEHLDVVKERLPFHCEPCDKKFVSYEYLMQHHYSVHLPKIVCTYCGKLFTQNRMSMHLRIHEPDRGSGYKGRKRGRKPTRKVSDS